MNVLIIESGTGRVVATVPVVIQGLNYTPDENQYYKIAWECAVDDKMVDEKNKEKYRFQLENT